MNLNQSKINASVFPDVSELHIEYALPTATVTVLPLIHNHTSLSLHQIIARHEMTAGSSSLWQSRIILQEVEQASHSVVADKPCIADCGTTIRSKSFKGSGLLLPSTQPLFIQPTHTRIFGLATHTIASDCSHPRGQMTSYFSKGSFKQCYAAIAFIRNAYLLNYEMVPS